MDWKIIIHNNPEYIEVITNGIADKEGSLGMAKAITGVMSQNRINKALIDHRNIESIIGEILDIYDMFQIFHEREKAERWLLE